MALVATFAMMAVPAYAAGSSAHKEHSGFNEEYVRVVDRAELLTKAQVEELESDIKEIRTRQKVDVAVVTIKGMDDSYKDNITKFTDDTYETLDYGYGNQHDGVMLLVDMKSRKWHITTEGYGIKALTDYGIEVLNKEIKGQLKDGDYMEAFESFINTTDRYISRARQGNAFDVDSEPKEFNVIKSLAISLVVGLVIAVVVYSAFSAQLKSVKMQDSAKYYTRKDSMSVTSQSDRFLYHTIHRTPRQTSSSGGSSTHSSSSGRTHGGGGGSF